MVPIDLAALPRNLLVGTSSWSWADWKGEFYSAKARPEEFIAQYSRRLPTVEIDSSFYRSPSPASVAAWARATPRGFLFSAKVPRAITEEKGLVGCEAETRSFLGAMSLLGEKLGPLVLQFSYVAKGKDPLEHRTGADFRRRLAAYLKALPRDFRYAVEVRNPSWLDEAFVALLAEHRAALVLSDYFTMPGLGDVRRRLDPLTTDFAYVRFLGHRKRMDELIAGKKEEGKRHEFDEVLLDRTEEMRRWVPDLRWLTERAGRLLVYFNNHYAGFAPGSVSLFARVWAELDSRDAPGSMG